MANQEVKCGRCNSSVNIRTSDGGETSYCLDPKARIISLGEIFSHTTERMRSAGSPCGPTGLLYVPEASGGGEEVDSARSQSPSPSPSEPRPPRKFSGRGPVFEVPPGGEAPKRPTAHKNASGFGLTKTRRKTYEVPGR